MEKEPTIDSTVSAEKLRENLAELINAGERKGMDEDTIARMRRKLLETDCTIH